MCDVLDAAQLARLERLEFSGVCPVVVDGMVGRLPHLGTLVVHDSSTGPPEVLLSMANRCPRLTSLVCSVSVMDDPDCIQYFIDRISYALPERVALAIECDPSIRDCMERVSQYVDIMRHTAYHTTTECSSGRTIEIGVKMPFSMIVFDHRSNRDELRIFAKTDLGIVFLLRQMRPQKNVKIRHESKDTRQHLFLQRHASSRSIPSSDVHRAPEDSPSIRALRSSSTSSDHKRMLGAGRSDPRSWWDTGGRL